jgi:hypothetical protein
MRAAAMVVVAPASLAPPLELPDEEPEELPAPLELPPLLELFAPLEVEVFELVVDWFDVVLLQPNRGDARAAAARKVTRGR